MADTTQTSLIPAWVTSWTAFVKAHERLVLMAVASLVLIHFSNDIRQWISTKHSVEQAQINQQISNQEMQNQLVQQELVKMQLNFDETVKSLNAKIDARKQAVIVQQKIDSSLPLPDLSNRWETLLSLQSGSIIPQVNGTVAVSTDAAHTTVNALEEIPQLKEQVLDTQTELKDCTDLSAKKDDRIAGLQTSVQQEKDGRAADAKVAKDNERKSFWKGTKIGAALTGIGLVAIKVLLVVK